jgi:cyclase
MAGRRAVLGGTVAGLAYTVLRPLAVSAAGSIAVEPLTGDIALLTGAGANVLVLGTGEGRVIVDSGAAEHADDLLATLAEIPGTGEGPVLFNTHWHLDQVGGNLALGRAGARIVSHAKTRARLATDYYLPLEDRYQRALPREAQPTETFYTNGQMRIGDRHVEYGYLLEAHTDGDIFVYFRDANIVAAGDCISPEIDPALDWFGGGWLGGRVDSLALLLEITDEATRYVPSHGPVVGRSAVLAEHEMLRLLFDRMVELVRKGMSAEEILAEGIMDDLGRSWDDPLRFVHDAHKGLWAHHNTLSHDVV